MKTFFIEARSNIKIRIPAAELNKLPEKIGVFTTVQYIGELTKIRSQLEKAGKKVYFGKGTRTKYDCQVLGCDSSAVLKENDADAFLYIGTGLFHPIGIGLFTDKPVFIFDPFSKKIDELDRTKVETVRKKRKGAVLKFLNSTKIGLLVSVKPGQSMLSAAEKIKKKISALGKKCYILLFDTIDFSELENFNFIECFVNTACPRISEDYERIDKPVAEYLDIAPYLNTEKKDDKRR